MLIVALQACHVAQLIVSCSHPPSQSGPHRRDNQTRYNQKEVALSFLLFLYTELQVNTDCGISATVPRGVLPSSRENLPASETLQTESPPNNFQKSPRNFVFATNELLASANVLWTPTSASFEFTGVVLHQTSSLDIIAQPLVAYIRPCELELGFLKVSGSIISAHLAPYYIEITGGKRMGDRPHKSTPIIRNELFDRIAL